MFISAHLDYCNALLSSISKLKCIQKAAARLLMGTTKFDRITSYRLTYILTYSCADIITLAPSREENRLRGAASWILCLA